MSLQNDLTFLSQFQPGNWAAPLDRDLFSALQQNPLEALNPEIPLESIIRVAQELTIQHFNFSLSPSEKEEKLRQHLISDAAAFHLDHGFSGWRMQMYAPIYVSSYCVNSCLYCGFHVQGKIDRTKLTVEETLQECEKLFEYNYRSILIVAGESDYHVPVSYLSEIISKLTERGGSASIEIAPQSAEHYGQLVQAGCRGVTLFQETYDQELYPYYHPRGPKSNFLWRYNSQRRAAEGGMHRLGFGYLVGLADPVEELRKMIAQAQDIQRDYPDSLLSFALPRIREAPNDFKSRYTIDDATFMRLYIVLRCAFPKAELVTSTRETAEYRDKLLSSCITWVSAGSSTRPGGYIAEKGQSPLDGFDPALSLAPQFTITDHRSVEQVAQAVCAMHHQIRW